MSLHKVACVIYNYMVATNPIYIIQGGLCFASAKTDRLEFAEV
jgi:hypothetical protein